MEQTFPQCENTCMILSSLYLAPIEYYSALFNSKFAMIEINENYQKQSYRNRCIIAGANGPLSLSIPIQKPYKAKCKMKDIRIADHGSWQHLHWNAIISAYSSTPFFQYYEDDFRPFYERKVNFLHDFNEELRILICNLIDIECNAEQTVEYIEENDKQFLDLREKIHPKRKTNFKTAPYYQVFAKKYGFLNNLSIIDLLFNMGNETRLFLRH